MAPSEVELRIVAEAARLWPEILVDSEAFIAHARDLEVTESRLDANGRDLYLAFACLQGQRAALTVLEREYVLPLSPVIGRVNSAPDFVAEVRQLVLERLLMGTQPRIARYAATGPLGAWLRVMMLRVALNHTKASRRREEVLAEAVADVSVPAGSENHAYREVVILALVSSIAALQPRERSVLRLHYVEALNIDRIGALYGVHRATVARWLANARAKILEQVEERVRTDLQLTPSEVRSVLGNVRSQLGVSLARLLRSEHRADTVA
jgi:RNA polymerase sigma-70 factor (ECF subfamily)